MWHSKNAMCNNVYNFCIICLFLQSFFLEGVLSQLINHLPLSGGGQSYIFLMEWVVAPIIAIVYAVILKIGVKIIGKVPHLSTALFGVKN